MDPPLPTVRIGTARRVHLAERVEVHKWGVYAVAYCGWAGLGEETKDEPTCRSCIRTKKSIDLANSHKGGHDDEE